VDLEKGKKVGVAEKTLMAVPNLYYCGIVGCMPKGAEIRKTKRAAMFILVAHAWNGW
jgi:hypothetical protein